MQYNFLPLRIFTSTSYIVHFLMPYITIFSSCIAEVVTDTNARGNFALVWLSLLHVLWLQDGGHGLVGVQGMVPWLQSLSHAQPSVNFERDIFLSLIVLWCLHGSGTTWGWGRTHVSCELLVKAMKVVEHCIVWRKYLLLYVKK